MLAGKAILQLFKPLAYLRIKNPTKAYFDWWLPLLFSVAAWIFFYFVVRSPKLFGVDGFVSGVNELLQALVGFYIAGLGVIATFNNPIMDESLSGAPVTLKEKYRGSISETELTRRRFLCYLFGYLSWISLALYFTGVIARVSRAAVVSMILPSYLPLLKFGLLFIYLFVLANLFVTTLLGLYYMSYRLHLAEPKDLAEKRK